MGPASYAGKGGLIARLNIMSSYKVGATMSVLWAGDVPNRVLKLHIAEADWEERDYREFSFGP